MTDLAPPLSPAPDPSGAPPEAPLASGKRRAATGFILFTVLLDIVALGVIIPVMPKLILHFVGTAEAAGIWVGVFSTLWAAMQFVASPIIGGVSDRLGRRPVVLASNLGLGLDYLLMAWAPTLPWLLLGRLISGVTSASISTAYAYIADVTPPEKRASAFGLMGAAFGLGFIVGPLIGGLLGELHPRLPFVISAGLSLLNAAYGFFVLPESLPKDRRSRFSLRKANPLASLGFLRSHRNLLGLAGVNLLAMSAQFALQTVFVLYAAQRYRWGPKWVGLCIGVVGICSAVVQGGITGPFVRRFGERASILTGLLFGAVGFAIYGLAKTGLVFLAGVPIMCLWGLTGPAAQGLMSQRVRPDEQGRLQGANAGMVSLAGIVAPLVYGGAYSLFNGRWAGLGQPGAPFYIATFCLLLAFALAWKVAHAGSGVPAD